MLKFKEGQTIHVRCIDRMGSNYLTNGKVYPATVSDIELDELLLNIVDDEGCEVWEEPEIGFHAKWRLVLYPTVVAA